MERGSFWAAGQLANGRLRHPAWPASRALRNDYNLHTYTRFPQFPTKKVIPLRRAQAWLSRTPQDLNSIALIFYFFFVYRHK